MHTEAYQFSVPAPLNPAQRLFRSLDGNADGQITTYEIKTSGVLLPKDPVAASAKSASSDKSASDTASKDSDSVRNSFSSSASRFQYFLAMMTQSAEKPAMTPKPASKPADTNPYLKVGDQSVSHAEAIV